jgi:hypothetical protein
MGFARLILFGLILLIGMAGWSWLRAQKSRWIVKRRGAVGWLLAMGVAVFLFLVVKALIP